MRSTRRRDRAALRGGGAVLLALLALLQIMSVTASPFSPHALSAFMASNPGLQPRNIRNLECVSKKTQERGTCMFALSCNKLNGTHLGVCVDRFYYGSCCRLPDTHQPDVDLGGGDSNDISSGSVTPTRPSTTANVPDEAATSSRPSSTPARPVSTSKPETTSKAPPTTAKPPATKPPVQASTTQKQPVTAKPTPTPTRKPATKPPVTTAKPASSTTKRPSTPTTARPTTVAKPSNTTRPNTTSSSSKPPPPKPAVTSKPTVKPSATTAKPSPSTAKPGSTARPGTTARPKPTTQKPAATTARPSSTTQSNEVTPSNRPSTPDVEAVEEETNTVGASPSTSKPPLKPVSTAKPPVKPVSTNKPTAATSAKPTTARPSPPTFGTKPSTPKPAVTSPAPPPSSTFGTKPSSTTDAEWVQIETQNASTATPPVGSVVTEVIPTSAPSVISTRPTPPTFPPLTFMPTAPSSPSTPAAENATTSTPTASLNGSYKDVCGRRLFPEARIVGGTRTSFGKWPWQISLRQWRTSTYLHKCGAALLNENWAITAAHCVENVPPSDLLLRLGEHDLSTEAEPYSHVERRVQIVASHPQFDSRTFEYDLALLRFYEPVEFKPNVVPICIPEDDKNFVGSNAFVTGWGRLYEDGPLPSVMQEVSVPVIENEVCETMYRSAGYIEHIPNIFICAGWRKGGFDSCEGDSGGPMVIQREDHRWVLAGVISWGIGCAEPNQPGVYTRISEFRDWINQILQF